MFTAIFPMIVILATLLCSLVAGLLLGFAIVAMPGIKNLNDREFIRSFQVMDAVIQNNHPIFMLVWMGSILTIVMATVIGFGQLDTLGRVLLISAALLYVFGVQLPTIMINIPLNNQLQSLNIDNMDVSAHAAARLNFEPRWNQSNRFRTGIATLTSLLLLILLFIV